MIKTTVKDNKLFIEVDITDADFKVSKSGKTQVISTGGNALVQGSTLKLGMNIMKPLAK